MANESEILPATEQKCCTLFYTALLVALTWVLCTKQRYRWFYILYRTLGRDFRAVSRFVRLNVMLYLWERKQETPAKLLTKLVQKHPKKVAFYFEDEAWTFEQLEVFSNKIANYFLSIGYKKGDTVALILENRPEYVGIWMGLSKIGVVSALINTNLKNDPLFHSISVSNSKALIYGSDFANDVKAIAPKLGSMTLFQFNEKAKCNEPLLDGAKDLIKSIDNASEASPTKHINERTSREKLLYIYTSGTTGLPKAAVITNLRFMFMSAALTCMIDIKEDDIVYDPLPLYHSAGGMVGVGQAVLQGITVALRRKFSASNFWPDCVKYKCTLAQYIGEICRYILAAQKDDVPLKHNVRALFGNGVKPQIWEKFSKLYDVKFYEFYGATEGNSNLINIDSKLGAVGFVPRYAGPVYPVSLIKCNEATGEPIRGENGLCIKCEVDEPGVFIGKIDAKKAHQTFTGYADKKATEKKVLENVFKKGDMYFNSGDILVQDYLGYFYFKDRTGDTFRWKGENVATSEVEAVISSVIDFKDAVVYGVEIPNTEGKAGMAAIVDTNKTLDLDKLLKGLKDNLPAYAHPLFIRVMESVPLTGTFKLKKTDLQKDGYDMNVVSDDLYYLNAKAGKYVRLTKELYEDIMKGKLRL